jgi:CheY-like chemotaxis protein
MAEKPIILVVEDEPSLRMLVRKVLERANFEVLEAASGALALELWNEDKPQIDLLLTDMVMPDGMSGRQLAERLRADNPLLKVLFTSGYSTDLLGKDLGLEEGLNFLQKPYPPSKLVETVRKALATN